MNPTSNSLTNRSRRKCANCGLVNALSDESCRRCGMSLATDTQVDPMGAEPAAIETQGKRGFLKRAGWVLGTTGIILLIWYASLLISSDGLQPDQREKVQQAIAVLVQQGFTR